MNVALCGVVLNVPLSTVQKWIATNAKAIHRDDFFECGGWLVTRSLPIIHFRNWYLVVVTSEAQFQHCCRIPATSVVGYYLAPRANIAEVMPHQIMAA